MIRRPPTQLPPTLPIYPLVKNRPELSSRSQLAPAAGAMPLPWAFPEHCSSPLAHNLAAPNSWPCYRTLYAHKEVGKTSEVTQCTRALDHHIPSPTAEGRWRWWDLSCFACETALQKTTRRQAAKSKLRLFVLTRSDRGKGSSFPFFLKVSFL